MSDIPSRALRDTLRDQLAQTPPSSPSSTSGCVDADTLAAWCDGMLSRRDRAVVESHAASCERCQAMLAAMARTATPVPDRKWWQVSTVRWLVPIAATAALAVAVWIKSPGNRQRLFVRPVSPVPSRLFPASPADIAPDGGKGRAGAAAQRSQPEQSERQKAEVVERRRIGSSLSPRAAESAESAAEQPPATEPEALGARETPASRAASAAPTRAPTPAEAPRAVTGATAEAVIVVQSSAFSGRTGALSQIASPSPEVRWRIVAGDGVERSTDSGVTWQAQATGVTGRLTAGAAPSSTVCWLVGAEGVVLLSTDGRTWQRVAFPEAIDLVAILATDGSNATVTAADGRVFSTTDGGKTWK